MQTINAILQERQLEEYYCTLCYARFDLERRTVTLSNSGLPYPIRCRDLECAQIEIPGLPLGSFPAVSYDEVTLDLRHGDIFVLCTDGIFETQNKHEEFGASRVCEIVRENRDRTARQIVDAIFDAVVAFRGTEPQVDDMTAVAIKVTA